MTGYVYAIENAVGLVKIGWSTEPKRRLSKINSDTSSPCKLIGYVEGTLEQEATLHRLLRPEVEHREWFRRGPLVNAFIKRLPPNIRLLPPKKAKSLPEVVGLEPARTIISRLGGPAAVRKATAISRYRVWRWTQPREKGGTGGLIPQRHHPSILAYARLHGIPLKPADFLPPEAREDAA